MMQKFWEHKWGLSLTAGLLLGLSFPPVNLSFLSIPAFILLFRLAEISDSHKQLAYYSYGGFVLWNVIGTYWLMMASLYAGVAAIVANAALMTIPLVLGRYFSQRFYSPVLIAFLQAASWVSYEYLHHNWDLAWPWLAIANAWSDQVSIIQYISITGHLGISFWVVLTAALAYQTIRTRDQRIGIYASVALLLLPTLSIISYWGSESDLLLAEEKTEVTVIQPNHDSYIDFGGMSGITEVMDSLFSITEKTRSAETQLIIWPENAIDGVIRLDGFAVNRIADSARSWNTAFIVGSGIIETYTPEEAPELVYGVNRNEQPYNIFNSSLYFYGDGSFNYYNKGNLVPIVERFPFVDFFNAIDVFDWVDWGRLSGYGKGTEATTLANEHFITGGLVCYDSVYPTWNRKFVQNGVDFITIITNDGWWGNTSGHHQHFAYARLRAIEFDRWIVRSANNGISGIIGPKGRIYEKTEYWVRTGFNFSVPDKNSVTLYTRFGDWLSYLSLLLCAAALLYLRFKKPSANE